MIEYDYDKLPVIEFPQFLILGWDIKKGEVYYVKVGDDAQLEYKIAKLKR